MSQQDIKTGYKNWLLKAIFKLLNRENNGKQNQEQIVHKVLIVFLPLKHYQQISLTRALLNKFRLKHINTKDVQNLYLIKKAKIALSNKLIDSPSAITNFNAAYGIPNTTRASKILLEYLKSHSLDLTCISFQNSIPVIIKNTGTAQYII